MSVLSQRLGQIDKLVVFCLAEKHLPFVPFLFAFENHAKKGSELVDAQMGVSLFEATPKTVVFPFGFPWRNDLFDPRAPKNCKKLHLGGLVENTFISTKKLKPKDPTE